MNKPGRVAAMFMVATLLCGCASIPDMSEEQTEMVSEYAAALILKYDSENHSRLVKIDDFINEYNEKKQAFEDAAQKYLEEQQRLEEEAKKEEEQRREETIKQEQGNADKDLSGDSDITATIIDNNEYSNETIAAYLGLNDFDIEFVDFKTAKNLVSESAFDISASKGNTLLITYFKVDNKGTAENLLDIMNKSVSFKFSVNEGRYVSAMINMSDDDLAQAYLRFATNESKTLILVTEVKDDISVESLSFKAEMNGKKPLVVKLR